MVKILIQTDKQKRYFLYIPIFVLTPFIHIAFSEHLWKFIHHQAKEKTVEAIYTNIGEIKILMKTLRRELKHIKLSDPLVDIRLKDGTSVKVAIT